MTTKQYNKRATFLRLYEDISLRYAVQWAKYERLSLTVVQLWIATFSPSVPATQVEAHYNMCDSGTEDVPQ